MPGGRFGSSKDAQSVTLVMVPFVANEFPRQHLCVRYPFASLKPGWEKRNLRNRPKWANSSQQTIMGSTVPV